MQLPQTQTRLLTILADGACHSGNELGQSLQMTRSAIWKHINQLIDLGVPIERRAQKGYQLHHPMMLLNSAEILKALAQKNNTTPYQLHLPTVIDSTNRYLKELPISQGVDVCCAETQTHGRGRFGRQWHSPFGENIYCSSRWNVQSNLSQLSGLSLVISLAVHRTLKEIHPAIDTHIKWPNDLLWMDKKLCGILIEINAESNSTAQVIIGIGINVNTDTTRHSLPDKPWCSLYEIAQHSFNRNEIIGVMLANIDAYMKRLIDQGLSGFMDEWQQVDYLRGKYITVQSGETSIFGIARGIDSSGLLILEDAQGAKHVLSSGDTSLHTQKCD